MLRVRRSLRRTGARPARCGRRRCSDRDRPSTVASVTCCRSCEGLFANRWSRRTAPPGRSSERSALQRGFAARARAYRGNRRSRVAGEGRRRGRPHLVAASIATRRCCVSAADGANCSDAAESLRSSTIRDPPARAPTARRRHGSSGRGQRRQAARPPRRPRRRSRRSRRHRLRRQGRRLLLRHDARGLDRRAFVHARADARGRRRGPAGVASVAAGVNVRDVDVRGEAFRGSGAGRRRSPIPPVTPLGSRSTSTRGRRPWSTRHRGGQRGDGRAAFLPRARWRAHRGHGARDLRRAQPLTHVPKLTVI